MANIEDVKIIRELGAGVYGIVYLVKDEFNQNYALKISKITEVDIKKSYASPFWREIEFSKTMNKLYPKHFMRLYDYEISVCPDCKEDDTLDKLEYEKLYEYDGLTKGTYYHTKLMYSLIDMDLYTYIVSKEFNAQFFYNLLIQSVYVVYLMEKEGYKHTDLHPGNLGVVYTDLEYIDILGNDIKTYGMIVQAIDYGQVLHKKYELTDDETDKLKNSHDMLSLIYPLNNDDEFYNLNIANDPDKYGDVFNNMTIDDYEKNILKFFINSGFTIHDQNFLTRYLYTLIFYQKYQRKYIPNLKETIAPRLLIDINNIFFMVYNAYDTNKILKNLLKESK
jgi:hypothetical protein